jgi:hypothetical protein
MSERELPAPVRQFVIECIDSVEQIEVLMFLREHRAKAWDATAVSRELRSAPESVAKRLKDLQLRKLIVQESLPDLSYRYLPQSEKLGQLVDALAEEYRTRRFTIINLIFSKPADALRTFADAFKIKKGDTENNDG